MLKRIVYWTPAIIWALFIFYLSSKPGLRVAEGYWDFATRKPAHIFVYFVLYFLIYFALLKSFTLKKFRLFVITFILTILYGVSDEIHQIYVPLREGKISDTIWDAFGALFAAFILWKYFQVLPTTLKNWLKK